MEKPTPASTAPPMPMVAPQLAPLGDAAWTVTWSGPPSAEQHHRVMALVDRITQAHQRGELDAAREWAPALTSVTLLFDPLHPSADALPEQLMAWATESVLARVPAKVWRLPVCFDADLAPDLPAVAEHAQCDTQQVIQQLLATPLQVYMLGFMPGFAYMGDLPAHLSPPRLSNPRTLVPARSLALAAGMAAVYPWASPGGWRLVGRTPLALFDLTVPGGPALMGAGDRVHITAISRDTFNTLEHEAPLDWAAWQVLP